MRIFKSQIIALFFVLTLCKWSGATEENVGTKIANEEAVKKTSQEDGKIETGGSEMKTDDNNTMKTDGHESETKNGEESAQQSKDEERQFINSEHFSIM